MRSKMMSERPASERQTSEQTSGQTSEPLLIEVVAYAPTAFYHCMHCEVVWQETGFSTGVHEEQVASALPADLQADYQAVSDWVRSVLAHYGDQVRVAVIDAASLEGFWRTVRHGLRRYPAIVIGRAGTYQNFAAAEEALARRLAPASR
jgi:hypothetical protein